MKKQIFLILACLVGAVQVFASGCGETDYCCPTDCCLDFDSKLTVDVGGGLRWDNLSWKSCGSVYGSSENFRQKWNDIKIGLIEADFQFLACEHYLLKGDFDYGWVYGKNHLSSSDFGSMDSFGDSSSSSGFSSKSNKGHAYDVSLGVGYQFNWDCYQIAFAPLVGYSYNFLKINRHGGITPYDSTLLSSSDSEISTSGHKFRLSGPWVGFAATYQATCEMLFYLDYAFHWATFRATVDDGFALANPSATDFSVSHRSKNTYGNEVTIGGIYTLCDCWFAGLKFNYKNWYNNKKHHHSSSPYSSSYDVGSSSSDDSSLRNFNWNTYIVTVDVGYTF